MARSGLEVADVFRDHGPAWREANRGHISLEQMKVMSAIERCRTAALGGFVARCDNEKCGHTLIAYWRSRARSLRTNTGLTRSMSCFASPSMRRANRRVLRRARKFSTVLMANPSNQSTAR